MSQCSKITIKNRHDLNIVLEHIDIKNAKGLAFIQHGLGGYKEQPHILEIAAAFHDHGISTINFDATHSFGESAGDLKHATITNHYHDLVDVIKWASMQNWFNKPFYLAGHSMGGASLLNYTKNHPNDVIAIAPISTLVSGTFWQSTQPKEELTEWQKTGFKPKNSSTKKDKKGFLSWALMEDGQNYDFTKNMEHLNIPALFIVGEKDDTTTPKHQQALYKSWNGPKSYHEIKNSEHTFRSKQELSQLRSLFDEWLSKQED